MLRCSARLLPAHQPARCRNYPARIRTCKRILLHGFGAGGQILRCSRSIQSLPLALTIAHIAKPINAPIISPIIKLIIFFVPLPIFKFHTACARHIRTVIIVIYAILTTHWLIQIIHTYLLPFLNKNAPTNDTALAGAFILCGITRL